MATLIHLEPLIFRVVLPPVATGPLSIRERIVQLIEARLKTIQKVKGYQTDLGVTVTEGMLIDAEPPVIPAINFYDTAETGQAEAGMINKALQLIVETFDKQVEGPTPTSLTQVARKHVLDVEQALFRDPATLRHEPTLGGLAVGMTLSQSQPHIGLKPIPWIGSISSYEIQYRTKAGNPYINSDEEE